MSENRKPIKQTVLDVMSMWLYADPVQPDFKRPNFRVKLLGNVPRVTVKTNVPNDKDNGMINFQTDLDTFVVMLSVIKRMADGKLDKGMTATYEDDFVAGRKLENSVVISKLMVDKDEKGRIYIAVISNNRPKIRFFFGPSKFHNLLHNDGTPVSEAEVSAAYAHAFATRTADLVGNLLSGEKFDPEARNVPKMPGQQGGQGGGGGNWQGGGNKGGNANYSQGGGNKSFDEDFSESTW